MINVLAGDLLVFVHTLWCSIIVLLRVEFQYQFNCTFDNVIGILLSS